MTEKEEPTLERYLQEARKASIRLENEDELIQSAANGDNAATSVLVESYLSLAAELGMRLAPARMSRLNAIQEANLVLVRLISSGARSLPVELGRAIADHFSKHGQAR